MFSTDFLEELERCSRCKYCTTKCPIFESYRDNAMFTHAPGGFLNAYSFLKKCGLKLDASLKQTLLECTTCKACEMICPLGIETTGKVIKEIRGQVIEEGYIPQSLQKALTNSYKYGNPWVPSKQERTRWAEGLRVKTLSEGERTSVLWFVGCTPAYHADVQDIARSMAVILNKAGLDFATLGDKERCCGDLPLQYGENGLFQSLAEQNMKSFIEHGIDRIVTTSPHCYNTLLKHYPKYEGELQIQHYTQFVWELIEQGKLKFSRRIDKVVTYHDPCYLGRHNGIYDEPRKILEAIPGLKLVEMERNRADAFCCGGGGGRLWIDETSVEKICKIRAHDAAETKAEILATACPFCFIELEDGVKSVGLEERLRVMDILQLIVDAL